MNDVDQSSTKPFASEQQRGFAADTMVSGATAEALGRKFVAFILVAAFGATIGVAIAFLPIMFIVGLLFGIVCAGVIIIKPFWGLVVYTLVFVVRPGELYPALAPLRLEMLIGATTLVALFLSQYRESGQLSIDMSSQSKLLIAFLFFVALSVPFAYWRKGAYDGFMGMVKVLAFYFMVVQLVNTRQRLRVFLWVYILLLGYLALDSLRTYLTGGFMFAQGIQRAIGTTSAGGNPNYLGTTLAAAFPIVVLLVPRANRLARTSLILLGLLFLVIIGLTGSRASLLGFLFGLMSLWWYSKRRLLTGTIGVFLIIAGFMLLPQQYKERYGTLTSSELDESSQLRIQTWKSGARMFLDHPFLGVGIRCFGPVHWQYSINEPRRSWLNAHNVYVQIFAELGLFGAIVFLVLLFEMLRLNRTAASIVSKQGEGWRFEDAVLTGVLAGFIVLLVAGLFGNSPLRRTWYVYAGIDLAILRVYLDSLTPQSIERTS